MFNNISRGFYGSRSLFTVPSAIRIAKSGNGFVRKQIVPACFVHSAPSSDKGPRRDKLDLGFNDNIAAFKSKTTMELIRGLFVYTVCSFDFIVENNMKVSLLFFLFDFNDKFNFYNNLLF